ncbi:MAG: hypothetical protein JRE24_07555 [Deltaproteobacteria bacterium]|nr:hypothetical protein [Deltaproteobacteria bacterium]
MVNRTAATVIKLTFLGRHFGAQPYLLEMLDEYIIGQVGINLAEVTLKTVKNKIRGKFFRKEWCAFTFLLLAVNTSQVAALLSSRMAKVKDYRKMSLHVRQLK